MKVSYSRVSSYLSCPNKHYFSYVEKLRLNKPARPLQFGGDFHKLLELRHDKVELQKAKKAIEDTYYEMNPIFQSELGENYLTELNEVFGDYLRLYKKDPEPVETEHEFLVKIGKFKGEDVNFHGIIDEVYSDNRMGEHKTFSRKPDIGILTMNMQVCVYSKAWEIETGKKFDVVTWDYIKSSPAQKPVWLEKSQRFSEAKNQQITPYSWLRACDEKGITDKDIRKKADLYKDNISNFFFKYNVELLPIMVDNLWDSFTEVVKDIAKRGSTNKVKNVTRDCSWCNYRALCYAEFTGLDKQYIIETDYIVREEEKEIKIEE